MELTRKSDSFHLYLNGLLGNKLRTWDAEADLLASGYAGTVTMRYKAKLLGSRFCEYDVSLDQIPWIQDDWVRQGADIDLITFNESAPDDKLSIQGEVMEDFLGRLQLFYSTDKVKMRDALKGAKQVSEESARFILEHYLTASSYSDLRALIEVYPEHAVEFSTYNHCLGDLRGRNTVIWEVRKY
jgi:hypothetical protein